jgi:heterodisulfide reductase subunit C
MRPGRVPVAREPEKIAEAVPSSIVRFCTPEAIEEVLTTWQEVIAELAAENLELTQRPTERPVVKQCDAECWQSGTCSGACEAAGGEAGKEKP